MVFSGEQLSHFAVESVSTEQLRCFISSVTLRNLRIAFTRFVNSDIETAHWRLPFVPMIQPNSVGANGQQTPASSQQFQIIAAM